MKLYRMRPTGLENMIATEKEIERAKAIDKFPDDTLKGKCLKRGKRERNNG